MNQSSFQMSGSGNRPFATTNRTDTMNGNAAAGVAFSVHQSRPNNSPYISAPANQPISETQNVLTSNGGGRGANIGQRSYNAYNARGSFNSPHGRRPNQNRGGLHIRQEWKTWSELTVKVRNFPTQTKTVDLWRALKKHGSVVRIRIPAAGANHAFIVFSPVPKTSFWDTGRVSIAVNGKIASAEIYLSANSKPAPLVPSPSRADAEHPEQTTLHLTRMDFGFLSQEYNMEVMKTIGHNTGFPDKFPDAFSFPAFSFTVNLKYKTIKVRFPCFIHDPRKEDPNIQLENLNFAEYRADISFRHITKVFCVKTDAEHWALVIPLPSPPIFFRRKTDLEKTHQEGELNWGDRDIWARTGEITFDPELYKQDRISLQRRYQFVDIGRWTTYRMLFRTADTADAWDKMRDALRAFNVQIVNADSETFRINIQTGSPSTVWRMVDAPLLGATNSQLALLQDEANVHLPFEVRYQLEAAISQGVFTEQSVTLEFLKKLEELNNSRGKFINKAKNILEYVTDTGKRIYDPMTVFTDKAALSHYPQVGLPEHCAWVRKVTVTPSTIYLGSPTPETTNRVLRQYASNTDRFIRVQFTDERIEGGIRSVPNRDTNDALFNRVFRTLQNGIQIGDRHFQFLAFGNSQFRENGAYFFCPTDHQSCDDIRNWMGDFSHIKVVAKYASRLGQCFSTTREPRGLHIPMQLEETPDIEHNGWCFSDGVGKISKLMARQIADRLDLNHNGNTPSAFQFRLGGSKGILVTWEDEKKEDYRKVKLRPSQKKFNAIAKSIEIIKPSRSSVATLNRQTIAIFSCLGVPDQVFIELTKDQLSDYRQAMNDSAVALKTLNRFADQNGTTTTIAQMITDGFMASKEPFMHTMLQLWKAWSMKLLREKARIVVEKGVFVFGCVDETNSLRGHKDAKEADLEKDRSKLPQIFLQVPKQVKSTTNCEQDRSTAYQIITGLCVVGRNPSLHPGDLRVVEAIDVPELRELRDVVVFPAQGDRDVPSMCSGGDLDGDDYFVFWDERMIPEEWNYPPMMHDTVQPIQHNGDVQIKDIVRFFVDYMKNDSLPRIALAHVAWADLSPEGPKDEKCIELAKLHSNAVDYVKTGRKAIMRKELAPLKWPHFMERSSKTYTSSSILGKLYDLVATVDFSPDFDGPFDQRILCRYRIDEAILKQARIIKTQYDISMRRIMNQREIKTEFEVWSTFVLSKPRVGTDYKVQEDMGVVMVDLRDRFTKECRDAANAYAKALQEQHYEKPKNEDDANSNGKASKKVDENSDLSIVMRMPTAVRSIQKQKPISKTERAAENAETETLNRFIAATYRITWEEVQIALQEGKLTRLIGGRQIPKRSKDDMPPISFPWLFGLELGRIARDASEETSELEELPPAPQITEVDGVEDAANYDAASLGEGRLFHRGEELFMASRSAIPDVTESKLEDVSDDSAKTAGSADETTEEPGEVEELEEHLEEDGETGLDALEQLAL